MTNLEKSQFIIVSGPVIIENGKVLLNRHGHDDENDQNELKLWKFPGGRIGQLDFVDDNALENACKREVKEEMGFEIEILSPLKPMIIKHPEKLHTLVILIHYLAKRIGNIKPGADIKEYKWFSINNLPTNCSPNIKPVISQSLRGVF